MAGEWDALRRSEEPADELLRRLGYVYVAPELLDADRDRSADAVLTRRARAAVLRLNPWISEDNARQAVRALTHIQAPGLVEANEIATTLLVHGASVEQDLGLGTRGQTVRFIDFAAPQDNDLVYTRRFRVRGAQREVSVELALFVNGVPLGVLACESPAAPCPLDQAIGRLLCLQELREEHRGQGAPRLFHTAQILAATCGLEARYGAVGAPLSQYAEWKVPHPLSLDRLEGMIGGRARPQEVLLAGLFAPKNLLDLVQNGSLFEIEGGGAARMLARSPQALAVDLVLRRIASEAGARRGGVIWHARGSGLSLTLVFLAVKLRRWASAQRPTLLIVTDRPDLERRIREAFRRCGFPDPLAAEATYDRLDDDGELARAGLRTLLAGPTGRTLLASIQSFETHGDERHPELNRASNVFVLVDLAHGDQHNVLAANMRQALPNACFVAFTDAPVEKNDRITRRIFGPLVHSYPIEAAVADGAIAPVFYETRAEVGEVEGAPSEAIAGSPERIARVCEDLIAHFKQNIQPNGFKALVVARDRASAAQIRETLDRLGGPASALLVSPLARDPERLRRWQRTPTEQRRLVEDLKDPDHPLAVLIVCAPLADLAAPVVQVLYLDAPLRDQALLRAISCVNRVADHKDHGLVVDYAGVTPRLADALAAFSGVDVAGAMRPRAEELPRLCARHRTATCLFQGVDREDPDACLRMIAAEDARAAFDSAFRRFCQSLDIALPDPAASDLLPDLRWLGRLRDLARTRFRDERLDLPGLPARVRRVLEDALRSGGAMQVPAPESIFSMRFDTSQAGLGSEEDQASELARGLRHACDAHADENPALYQTISRTLQRIADARREGRIDAAAQLRQLQGVVQELRQVGQSAAAPGLDEHGFALYALLAQPVGGLPMAAEPEPAPYGSPLLDAPRRDLAREIAALLQDLAVVDWATKEDVQRRMRQEIKTLLKARGWDRERAQAMTVAVMELTRARRA